MSRYQQDPDDQFKSIPKPLPQRSLQTAEPAIRYNFYKTPSRVHIASDAGEDIAFYFNTSASFSAASATEGGPTAATVLSGSSHYVTWGKNSARHQPIDIQPTAWSGSSAANVVFLYDGGIR
tara:strand:+ start:1800 stop:2165 length:366 start_codon:yes stop_codon:yes gene_type:complete